MKLCLVFALVLAVASADLFTEAEKTKLQTLSDSCVASTRVSKEVLVEMRNNQLEEDKLLKDYLFCIFKKLGFQKEDGTLVKKKIMSFVAKDTVAEEAMKPCVEKIGTTGPETAFSIFKCYKLNLPVGYKSTL